MVNKAAYLLDTSEICKAVGSSITTGSFTTAGIILDTKPKAKHFSASNQLSPTNHFFTSASGKPVFATNFLTKSFSIERNKSTCF